MARSLRRGRERFETIAHAALNRADCAQRLATVLSRVASGSDARGGARVRSPLYASRGTVGEGARRGWGRSRRALRRRRRFGTRDGGGRASGGQR